MKNTAKILSTVIFVSLASVQHGSAMLKRFKQRPLKQRPQRGTHDHNKKNNYSNTTSNESPQPFLFPLFSPLQILMTQDEEQQRYESLLKVLNIELETSLCLPGYWLIRADNFWNQEVFSRLFKGDDDSHRLFEAIANKLVDLKRKEANIIKAYNIDKLFVSLIYKHAQSCACCQNDQHFYNEAMNVYKKYPQFI